MAAGPGFTILGIPVRIQPIFFGVIIFLGLFQPPQYIATWVLIATVSILVHEFGHAIAFQSFGLKPRITLHAMGGLTSASTGSPDRPFTPVRSIITSLAGPLAALVLFGLPALWIAHRYGFDPWHQIRPYSRSSSWVAEPTEVILGQIVYINVGWSLLNLIPVLPLDGGNVTASLCELVVPRRGRRIANIMSIAVSIALAIWGYRYVGFVAPIFAAMFIGLNIRELTSAGEEDMDEELAQATRALLEYDPARAEQLARSVMARSPGGERMRRAVELAAWARLAAGDSLGAQHLLVGMPPGAAPSASIRGALALAMGQTAEGVAMLAWALTHDTAKHALMLGAIAAAQSKQVGAITHELLLMGPSGIEAAARFRDLLHYAGHRAEAEEVNQALALATPRPPGW